MRDSTRYEKIQETAHSRYIELPSGRRVVFYDAEREADRRKSDVVRWVHRMFKLAGEYDWDSIDSFVWRVESLAGAWRAELDKRNVRVSREERIAQLRNVAGRTPEEAEIYLAKADELERGLA